MRRAATERHVKVFVALGDGRMYPFRDRRRVPLRGWVFTQRLHDTRIASLRYRAVAGIPPKDIPPVTARLYLYRRSSGGDTPVPHPLGLSKSADALPIRTRAASSPHLFKH